MMRQAESLTADLNLINFADLDPARVDDWIARLTDFRRALGAFIDRLKATAVARQPEPIELLHDVEILQQQRDDWARGLDWLALHAEFSRPAKDQLGADYVPLADDIDAQDGRSPDLSLGDYIALAAQTGNADAIDAFCRWSRTSVSVVNRELDWPTILLSYRAKFEALKEMARERESEPDQFPRSDAARKLLAELATCGFDEASVFGAQRETSSPRRRLAEVARVLVAKRYGTTPKTIEHRWKDRKK
ncbi:MAG: hypothetical protein ACRD2A_03115 [Vicinamibacterales bacterium]